MRTTSIEKIKELHQKSKHIRNICILAHVDHGKTTLADNLIACNGIISNRMAGKLRYMDSREDEQLRGITMKSSAISLQYMQDGGIDYLINLIDSPGHVDFSSEVCTAVRLCDGAIIVVDVVEGVCPQTQAVLRQAWLEKLTPVLVLNKIDRLIVELKYTPLEAYIHLENILQRVNAVTGSLFSAEVMEKNSQKTNTTIKEADGSETTVYDWSSGLEETDDSNLYFSPDQGNVVFSSATDGWGFRIQHFAKIFSKKLGIREVVLNKTLWGDYYINTKAKKILKGAQAKGKKPLFVQFVLENLWSVYDAVMIRRDQQRSEKITQSLDLKISSRDSRMLQSEPKTYLHAICCQWLPLSEAVLAINAIACVCEHLPSPVDILEERVEGLMCGATKSFNSLPEKSQVLKKDFLECNKSSTSTIVLVSKMVSVNSEFLPQNKQRPLTLEELKMRREAARQRHVQRNDEKEKNSKENTTKISEDNDVILENGEKSSSSNINVAQQPLATAISNEQKSQQFVAFARVFSGTLRKGQKLFVLGPKYDPALIYDAEDGLSPEELLKSSNRISEAVVGDVYLWMGKELESIDEAPAGAIVGIGGLEDNVLNSATLCDTAACPPFNALSPDTSPIIRVAVDPKNLSEMGNLMEGLRLLNQADPCVQVLVQDTGEHVIVAAGEVHLQKCLEDLRDRFAKIEINASEPIVPFRETIVPRPKVDMLNEALGTQEKNMMVKWGLKEKESGDPSGEDGGQTKKSSSDKLGLITIQTPNKKCTLALRATPLPAEVTKILVENSEFLKVLTHMEKAVKELLIQRRRRLESTGSSTGGVDKEESFIDQTPNTSYATETSDDENSSLVSKVLSLLKVKSSTLEKLRQIKVDLEQAFILAGRRKWSGAVDRIWAFGPRGNGPNTLLNHIDCYNRPSVWTCVDPDNCSIEDIGSFREFDHSLVSGFQLATLSGPLCEEPLHGVCFVVEHWDLIAEDTVSINRVLTDLSVEDTNTEVSFSNETGEHKTPSVSFSDAVVVEESTGEHSNHSRSSRHLYGPLSGQLISTCKETCRKAFQAKPQRLMAAMYTCSIQATADVLGKLYAVLGRREGRVLSEDLRDGSDSFNIEATLPVAESFGFAEEVRKRTSGLASPQLVFSHWEVVASDPFWVPTTEEEIQHFGEKADFENQATKYMNAVRRRKGLFVEEKTVEHAEKQRTLTKNK